MHFIRGLEPRGPVNKVMHLRGWHLQGGWSRLAAPPYLKRADFASRAQPPPNHIKEYHCCIQDQSPGISGFDSVAANKKTERIWEQGRLSAQRSQHIWALIYMNINLFIALRCAFQLLRRLLRLEVLDRASQQAYKSPTPTHIL